MKVWCVFGARGRDGGRVGFGQLFQWITSPHERLLQLDVTDDELAQLQRWAKNGLVALVLEEPTLLVQEGTWSRLVHRRSGSSVTPDEVSVALVAAQSTVKRPLRNLNSH